MRYLLVLILAGCATDTQQWAWYRDGATRQQYEADQGACQAQAMGVHGAMNNLLQVAAVENSCMRGKGWYQKPVPR